MRSVRVLVVIFAMACGDDGLPRCASPTECEPGERCVNGFCVPPGVDGGEEDAGVDAARADVPGVDAPGVDAPRADVPGVDAPGVDAPVDVPVDAPPHVPDFIAVDIPLTISTSATSAPVPGSDIELAGDGRDWIVLVSAQLWTESGSSNGAEMSLHVDGARRARSYCRGSESPECAFQAFDYLPAGAHSIRVDIEGEPAFPAELRDLRLVVFPLPAGTAVVSDGMNSDQMIDDAAGDWVTRARIDVPAGDYVVLVTGAVDKGTNGVGAELRISDSLDGFWPNASPMGFWNYFHSRTNGWRSVLWARAVSGGSRRLTMEASKAGALGAIVAAHNRILAIPASAFAGVADFLAPAPVDNPMTTLQTAATSNVAGVSPTRDTILIASSVLTFEADVGAVEIQLGDETTLFLPSNPDNDRHEHLCYGRVGAVSRTAAFDMAIRWGLGGPVGTFVEIKEASLLALDLLP